MKTPFWLDSNVYIEAKNRYYKFDRVPKFWSFLHGKLQDGSICSPKYVYNELISYRDQLATWVRTRKSMGICIPMEQPIQTEMNKVADHVAAKYPRHKCGEFLSDADPWVIACAMSVGGTVVTQESSSRKTKVRIPTVCQHFKYHVR